MSETSNRYKSMTMLTTNSTDQHVPMASHSSVRGNALADTSNVETIPKYLLSPSDVLKEADDRLLLGRWYALPSENEDAHGMQGSVMDVDVKPVLSTPDTYTLHCNRQSIPGFVPSVVYPSLHSVYGKPTDLAQDINMPSLSPQRSQLQLVTTVRTLQCGTMADTVFNELQNAGNKILEEHKLTILNELQLSQLVSQDTLLDFEYGKFMPSVPNYSSDLTTVSHLASEIDTHALIPLPVQVLPTSVSIASVVSSSVTAGSGKSTDAGGKMASKKDPPTNQYFGLSSEVTDSMDKKSGNITCECSAYGNTLTRCDSKSSQSQEFSEIQCNEMPLSMSSKMAEFGVTSQIVNSNLVAESGEFSDDDFEEIFIERDKRKSESYPSTLSAPKRVPCQGSSTDIVQPRGTSVRGEELLVRDKNLLNSYSHTGDRLYKCEVCSYAFSQSNNLKRHMMIHKGEKPYKCEVCGYACNQRSSLKNHIMIHTGEKPYKCEVCGYAFKQSSKLKIHMRIHTGERLFKCELCDYACEQNCSLKAHMRKHTEERPYKCEVCFKAFKQSGHLTTHMKIHTGEIHTGERLYKCELCDYACEQNCSLKAHMRVHTEERPYKCEVCFKAFKQSSHLTTHMKIHTGERPYKCEVCDYASKMSSTLKTHMKIHTGERPYECEVCDYACHHIGNLKAHMRKHTEKRPYKCEVCFKAFKQSGHLTTHMKIHTGEIHTGERLYKCELCDYACEQNCSLKAHMRVHTEERPYKCEVCFKTFKQSSHLTTHMKIHTGIDRTSVRYVIMQVK